MSDELEQEVVLELEHMHRLFEDAAHVLSRIREGVSPPRFELYGLALLLQSFYGGVENIFKRISKRIDKQMPSGDAWHRQLLDSMKVAISIRPPVISPSLWGQLDEYLRFRHFIRNTYAYLLDWRDMDSLVIGLEKTMALFEQEIRVFLATRRPLPDGPVSC